MTDAFYEPLDATRFRATRHTTGPWSPDAQHGGPPVALLGGELERALGMPLARITAEILRPVPIADLDVSVTVVKRGRTTGLIEGVLSHDGAEVLRARATGVRREPIDLPDDLGARTPAPDDPESFERDPFTFVTNDVGYHTSVDLRFVRGGWHDLGPATAWMRSTLPVVAGRDDLPLQQVLTVADSGNGISHALPFGSWLFINTDLTVHLTRPPVDGWIRLDAVTHHDRDGVGLAECQLQDRAGHLGRSLQTLLLAPVAG